MDLFNSLTSTEISSTTNLIQIITLMSLVLLIPLVLRIPVKEIEKLKNHLILIFFTLIPPVINTSEVYIEGIDYYIYNLFYITKLDGIPANHGDLGFDTFSSLMSMMKVPPFLFFWVISVFQIYIVYWFLKKYSINWRISFSLYILMYYYVNNFNGIRQGVALSFILIFVDSLLTKRRIKAFTNFILSVSMHASSLIIIVFFWIKKITKPRAIKVILVFILTQIFGVVINKLIKGIIAFIVPAKYSAYFGGNFLTDYRFTLSYFIYLSFLSIMIAYITYLSSKKNKNSSEDVFFINVTYVGILYALITSSFIILRRLNLYFLFFYLVSLVNTSYKTRYKNYLIAINIIIFIAVALLQ